jgi:phospholipase C
VPSFADSDHATSNSLSGPSWVSAIVNAIGTSPNWSTTAIFVIWDDWGGWYDHVAPPVSENYTNGGFRVPVLCISPYSENANPTSPVVDHTLHGSDGILTFIEQNFNLGSLNAQDARDTPFNDCFNFHQAPKPFIAIPAGPYSPSYFLREETSDKVPDTDQ